MLFSRRTLFESKISRKGETERDGELNTARDDYVVSKTRVKKMPGRQLLCRNETDITSVDRWTWLCELRWRRLGIDELKRLFIVDCEFPVYSTE